MTRNPANNRERQKRWYRNHTDEKLKLTRERYWSLRNAGLCPGCGGQRETKKILCNACGEKRRVK